MAVNDTITERVRIYHAYFTLLHQYKASKQKPGNTFPRCRSLAVDDSDLIVAADPPFCAWAGQRLDVFKRYLSRLTDGTSTVKLVCTINPKDGPPWTEQRRDR